MRKARSIIDTQSVVPRLVAPVGQNCLPQVAFFDMHIQFLHAFHKICNCLLRFSPVPQLTLVPMTEILVGRPLKRSRVKRLNLALTPALNSPRRSCAGVVEKP
jgi:hypothetical protein